MKLAGPGDIALIQEDELAWCAANTNLEIAQRILQLNDRAVRGEIAADSIEFGEAAQALRRIRPRQAFQITEILTYLAYDPLRAREGFIVGGETRGLVPGLTAPDRPHLLSLMPAIRAQQAKFSHVMRLYSFPFDRVIAANKIAHLHSRNTKDEPTAEIFAYVTRTPHDDEVVVGIGSSKVAPTMLMHQMAEGIAMMNPLLQQFRDAGMFVELRRFVKGPEITDPIFNPRLGSTH